MNSAEINMEARSRGLWNVLSRIVSVVMHPFLLPIAATIAVIYYDPLASLAPVTTRIFFVAVVFLNVIIIPSLSIGLLRSTGYISDISLDERKDRPVPMVIIAICYGICIYMVKGMMFGFLLQKVLIAACACTLLSLFITLAFQWKVSIHMTGAGATTAILVVLAIAGFQTVFWPLIIAVLLSGALGAARMYLGKHTLGQVGAGYMSGFTVSFLALLIF